MNHKDLRKLRKKQGLNNTQMAKLIRVSPSYYSQLESGQRPITAELEQILTEKGVLELAQQTIEIGALLRDVMSLKDYGFETVNEGPYKVPKPGGRRRGWFDVLFRVKDSPELRAQWLVYRQALACGPYGQWEGALLHPVNVPAPRQPGDEELARNALLAERLGAKDQISARRAALQADLERAAPRFAGNVTFPLRPSDKDTARVRDLLLQVTDLWEREQEAAAVCTADAIDRALRRRRNGRKP